MAWKRLVGGQSRVGLTASSTGAPSISLQATPASAKALQPAADKRAWQERLHAEKVVGQQPTVSARQ
eukprot:94241-Prymnesium_polylepis.1